MDDNFSSSNPYSNPGPDAEDLLWMREKIKRKVNPPAIFLIVADGLRLAASVFGVVHASVAVPQIDPNVPPWVRKIKEGSTGPVTAAIQGIFAFVNIVIIFSAAQMMQMRSWGLALTASTLAMVNFGSCCCLIGLPAGIWSIVVCVNHEVREAFEASARM